MIPDPSSTASAESSRSAVPVRLGRRSRSSWDLDNVDPAVRDEAMFFGYWGVATQFIGDGAFVLRFSGTES
jgi:hypothetical protein